jgi:MYXO-CTERM domain-containing protein
MSPSPSTSTALASLAAPQDVESKNEKPAQQGKQSSRGGFVALLILAAVAAVRR